MNRRTNEQTQNNIYSQSQHDLPNLCHRNYLPPTSTHTHRDQEAKHNHIYYIYLEIYELKSVVRVHIYMLIIVRSQTQLCVIPIQIKTNYSFL